MNETSKRWLQLRFSTCRELLRCVSPFSGLKCTGGEPEPQPSFTHLIHVYAAGSRCLCTDGHYFVELYRSLTSQFCLAAVLSHTDTGLVGHLSGTIFFYSFELWTMPVSCQKAATRHNM